MKFLSALVSMMFLVLAGCGGGSSSGSTDAITPEVVSEINDAIVRISQASTDNKVVVSYGLTDGNQVFEFSDGSSALVVDNGLISSVSENTSLWRLVINFSNATSANLNLQPSSIGVSNSNITLNPSGYAPLSAEASFEAPFPGQIRVAVPGKGVGGIRLEHTFVREGTAYQIPIHGLYQDYVNPVEIQFLDVSGNILCVDEVAVETEALTDAPIVNIVSNNLPATEDKLYMEVGLKHAFDQAGEFRWAYSGGDVFQIFERLPNGNWLVTGNADKVLYHWPYFHEMDMFGNLVETYSVPNLGHHEVVRMVNGNYLVAGNSVAFTQSVFLDDEVSQEDTVQEVSAETGEVIAEYDFNELLDPAREILVEFLPGDWLHINAVYEDAEDNSIVVSGRHQAAIVKVSRSDGGLEWILSPHEQWPESLQSYLLTPVDSAGSPLDVSDINFWPYGQHAISKLPNGNVLLYDNGNDRGLYKGPVLSENLYSRAVEYQVDAVSMTVQKVWEYDYMRSFYSTSMSDVDYLADTGGRLISFMGSDGGSVLAMPRVVELDGQNNIVFEYVINQGESDLYRTAKFDLYENVQ
ncbi:MAG: aryl-sulfate sulfotransferase [Agarilytica sp.]